MEKQKKNLKNCIKFIDSRTVTIVTETNEKKHTGFTIIMVNTAQNDRIGTPADATIKRFDFTNLHHRRKEYSIVIWDVRSISFATTFPKQSR